MSCGDFFLYPRVRDRRRRRVCLGQTEPPESPAGQDVRQPPKIRCMVLTLKEFLESDESETEGMIYDEILSDKASRRNLKHFGQYFNM